jgi:amidase
MGEFKEYDQYDGLGLAGLIRNGDVSAEEVCDAAIERIERVNPSINAVVTPMFDIARQALTEGLVEGPFTGVPFLLKDLVSAFKGVPLTSGSRSCRHYVPDYDSELVKRYKASGAITLGKTNTPEFGLLGYTEPELFGPTRNPWHLDRTPGGSSGGSAAAVAAGLVPVASGGDGGGSIRIPASCCGLFGLKPSRGRTPTGPFFGELWQGATVEHILSRTVRDSAAMLDATNGPDSGAPYVIAPPERPYLQEVDRDPGPLRIAFTTRSAVGGDIHPEIVAATEETAQWLEKLGHRVSEAQPEIDELGLARSFICMYCGEVAASLAELPKMLGHDVHRADIETATWTLGLLGRVIPASEFVRARWKWQETGRVMGRFHESYDVFLTPTIAQPPVGIGELKLKPAEEKILQLINALKLGRPLKMSGLLEKIAFDNLARTPFTQWANFTGQPAMSVPLHWTSDGLPCGMQFMAAIGDEATLFRLAAQLETEKPWFDKRPKMAD